jgi:hypothetical protein
MTTAFLDLLRFDPLLLKPFFKKMQKICKKTYKHCTSINSPHNSALIDVQKYEIKENKNVLKIFCLEFASADRKLHFCFSIFIDI